MHEEASVKPEKVIKTPTATIVLWKNKDGSETAVWTERKVDAEAN